MSIVLWYWVAESESERENVHAMSCNGSIAVRKDGCLVEYPVECKVFLGGCVHRGALYESSTWDPHVKADDFELPRTSFVEVRKLSETSKCIHEALVGRGALPLVLVGVDILPTC